MRIFNGFREQKCGTAAGPMSTRYPHWVVIRPDGSESGFQHARFTDIASELMEIDAVASEVNDRLRSAREMNWGPDDARQWVKENAPVFAKQMGYRIVKR